MSLSLPFPLSYDYELERQRRLVDQHFCLGIYPDDLLSAVSGFLLSREYHRPWRHLAVAARDLGSNVKTDKYKFQVSLDVKHFAAEEISVKTADGFIVVEGRQEEKKDLHGYVSRQFKRRYALPEGCDPEAVESKLSCDGVLTVVAPRKVLAGHGERNIPITLTGPIKREASSASAVNSPNGDK